MEKSFEQKKKLNGGKVVFSNVEPWKVGTMIADK